MRYQLNLAEHSQHKVINFEELKNLDLFFFLLLTAFLFFFCFFFVFFTDATTGVVQGRATGAYARLAIVRIGGTRTN